MLDLKLKKSAGIAVTAAVHRLIRDGNAARDGRRWDEAATAYRAALRVAPDLRHIHIQHGHMLKEAGRPDEAVDAYEAAFALDPTDPEPAILLAHLEKQRGAPRSAARCFVRAIGAARDADPGEALEGLRLMMAAIRPIDPATLYRAVRHDATSAEAKADPAAAAAAFDGVLAALPRDDADAATLREARALLDRLGAALSSPTPAAAERVGVVFDVTDLVAHFRHHRLPTGIQRVQIEVVMRLLHDPAIDTRVCCFVSGRDDLLDIPAPLFLELALLSTAGKDNDAPEWQLLMGRLFLHLLLADAFPFRAGDRLVNLGTSWWVYNYFLLVRNAKRDFGISYIPFVHDFIPVMTPEHCVAGVIEDYLTWLVGVFGHADFFLVNSHSTARDLMQVADRLGHPLDPADVEVVALDADFRRPGEVPLPPAALARWDLADADYCLIVSTIESRKNHVLALEAWARLIAAHGLDKVPMLVCVGRSGWLNADFFDRLARDPRLARRVLVIDRVSDDELALLYRRCRFTVYPSHYEGWGLPVTESLCYSKVPVVADNSSLPEAGGAFAVYFESNSVSALVAAVEPLLLEDGRLATLEQAIVAAFRPRSWSAIARQIRQAVAAPPAAPRPFDAPRAGSGRYYPVSLYKGRRIWRGLESGETFRDGDGWHWPEPDGSRTMANGGLLRFRATADGPIRLYLLLRGLATMPVRYAVVAGSDAVANGRLRAGEIRWVLADVPAPVDGVVSLLIRGDRTETVDAVVGGVPRVLEVGIKVSGLAIVNADDGEGRMAFIEGAVLAGLDAVDAYAERVSA